MAKKLKKGFAESLMMRTIGMTGRETLSDLSAKPKRSIPKYNPERLLKASVIVAEDRYKALAEAYTLRMELEKINNNKAYSEAVKLDKIKEKVANTAQDIWKTIKKLLASLMIIIEEKMNRLVRLNPMMKISLKAISKKKEKAEKDGAPATKVTVNDENMMIEYLKKGKGIEIFTSMMNDDDENTELLRKSGLLNVSVKDGDDRKDINDLITVIKNINGGNDISKDDYKNFKENSKRSKDETSEVNLESKGWKNLSEVIEKLEEELKKFAGHLTSTNKDMMTLKKIINRVKNAPSKELENVSPDDVKALRESCNSIMKKINLFVPVYEIFISTVIKDSFEIAKNA